MSYIKVNARIHLGLIGHICYTKDSTVFFFYKILHAIHPCLDPIVQSKHSVTLPSALIQDFKFTV